MNLLNVSGFIGIFTICIDDSNRPCEYHIAHQNFTTCGIAHKCLLGPSMKLKLSTNSIALYYFQI